MYIPFMRPMVIYANYYRFRPGERLRNKLVHSRMLLWCRSGSGRITLADGERTLVGDDLLFLPWRHTIQYDADRDSPFFVGGLHIVPDCSGPVPQSPEVDRLFDEAPNRRDAKLGNICGTLAASFRDLPRLRLLAEYVVGLFTTGDVPEKSARLCASLLLGELMGLEGSRHLVSGPTHPAFTKMRQFAEHELHRNLCVGELAAAGNLGPAQATRVFKLETGESPAHWLSRLRMDKAEELLRTTSWTIAEIGRAVGVEDPYAFSKMFRRIKGRPPSELRRLRPLF